MTAAQPPRPVRVMVVEDNFYTRLGTVAFLRAQTDVEVVGEAADGVAALGLLNEVRPDVVVVDLRMPSMDGVALTTALRERAPRLPILVLTHYDGEEDIFAALKAGARGYLTKEAPGEELLAAVRALAAGERFLPAEIVSRMERRMTEPELTRRERQVLTLLAEGASNRETAERMGIAERTVAIYVSSILGKLDARSRTEAVVVAVRRGLLPGPPR